MAMRNPNGYGAVFKLQGKRRKPWAVVKTVSINTGKQKRVLLGTFEKRPEAVAFLADYNRNPYDLKEKDITLYEIYEFYYENQVKKVTEGTLKSYKTNIKFFTPLHEKPIREIKLFDLQLLFDSSNLSYNSLTFRKGLATSLFEFAVKRNLVDKNIASLIEINKKNEPTFIREIFTEQEIDLLWENLNNNTPENIQTISMILIMIYTSLRIGELLELEIKNINLDSEIKYIDVVKSKTKAGIRKIPIHDRILPLILNYVQSNEIFLFENNVRKLKYLSWNKYHFQVLLENLGMKHRTHDCRHTFATRMAAINANPVAIRQLVGHEGGNFTEKVYTHLSLEELKKAIDLLL